MVRLVSLLINIRFLLLGFLLGMTVPHIGSETPFITVQIVIIATVSVLAALAFYLKSRQ